MQVELLPAEGYIMQDLSSSMQSKLHSMYLCLQLLVHLLIQE